MKHLHFYLQPPAMKKLLGIGLFLLSCSSPIFAQIDEQLKTDIRNTSYVGGETDGVLGLDVEDFLEYFDAACDLYKEETKRPTRVILSGIEKR